MKKLTMFLSAVFLSLSFSAFADEGKGGMMDVESMLPDYYPKYSSNRGVINSLDFKRDVFQISGVMYNFADSVKVYFTSTKNGSLTMLREGQTVLYDVDNSGAVTSVWVLPAEFSMSEG